MNAKDFGVMLLLAMFLLGWTAFAGLGLVTAFAGGGACW